MTEVDNPYSSGDRVYYYENGLSDQGIVVGPITSPQFVTVIWENDNTISEHEIVLIAPIVKRTK